MGLYTDGMYHTGHVAGYQNVLIKSFYTRDSAALYKAVDHGLDIIFLTSAMDNVIDEKMKNLSTETRANITIIKMRHNKEKRLGSPFWTRKAYLLMR